METKEIALEKLIPYEKNNKLHNEDDIKEMARSIDLFGWTQPIVIDEQNSILAGHRRYHAALSLGLKKVPCLVVRGLDEARRKQYRLVDNKLSSAPAWNYEAIEAEMIELQEADLDIVEFGLDEFIDKKETVTASSGTPGNQENVGFTIQYTFVFDTEIQQSRFYDFMRELKNKYDGETAAARFDQFLDDHWGNTDE